MANRKQARRDRMEGNKPVRQSANQVTGIPENLYQPNPAEPQGPGNMPNNGVNALSQQEQMPAGMSIDGAPIRNLYNDANGPTEFMGTVQANAPSGTRQGYLGFRGQNMQFDEGLTATPAEEYDQLATAYDGMQAMTRNQTQAFAVSEMGMSGTGASGDPGEFPEFERGVLDPQFGVQSADISSSGQGMSFGGPNNSGRNKRA